MEVNESQTPNGQSDFKGQLSTHYRESLGQFMCLSSIKLVENLPDGASPEQIKQGILNTSWPSGKSFGAPELKSINLDGTAKVQKLLQNMRDANDPLSIGKAYVGLLGVLDDNGILDTALPLLNGKIDGASVKAATVSPSQPASGASRPKPLKL